MVTDDVTDDVTDNVTREDTKEIFCDYQNYFFFFHTQLFLASFISNWYVSHL